MIFDQQMLETVYHILSENSHDPRRITTAGKCTEILIFSFV